MRVNQFYCVRCRSKVTGDDICVKYIRNSKLGKIPMLRGFCPKCDEHVYKFVKHADAGKLEDKYGKCR